MNRRLISALLRRPPAPAPAIVPFLIEAIDRCDPTRSHEAKPSERMRAHHRRARLMRTAAAPIIATLIMAGGFLFARGGAT